MSIKNLFDPNFPKKEIFDPQLNRLILNEAVIAAIEDNEPRFESMLSKASCLMEKSSLFVEYEIASDSRDGHINQVELEDTTSYRSFLHLAVDLLPEKYALKVASKALKEDLTEYFKYDNTYNNIQIVNNCFKQGKSDLLDMLIQNQFLSEKDVLRVLFINNNAVPEVALRLCDSQVIIDTFKENVGHNSRVNADIFSKRVKEWIPKILKSPLKNEIKEAIVPFLIHLHEGSSRHHSNDPIKRLLIDFMEVGLIEPNTTFDKSKQYQLGIGNKTIAEQLFLNSSDLDTLNTKKITYLAQHLENSLPQKVSKPQIKI